jgi:asparagine synthase (glutamine-hydrolysing)
MVRAGGITVGNTRLAIQNPTPAGNQPFVSADGRYVCVFNGEIYNHRQLADRFRLPARTGCDGEVIPHLWAKLGIRMLTQLRGMFAIAVADTLEQRLYLARDPFGIKPLYWRPLPDGTLIFASEVRALAELAPETRVDSAAVARYLHYGAMAAGQSPFAEISAIPPNSVAVVTQDLHMDVRPIHKGGPLAVRQQPSDLGEALTESVDLHLGADVPTVLLLSGGVDSAAVAAISRRLGRDLECVTVAVGGPADETEKAAQTARHYGHPWRSVPTTLEDGDVARFFKSMQRPSVDGLNTYLICKAVSEAGFKVALSGLGGDEAVGGYAHFRLLRYLLLLRAVDSLPRPLVSAAAMAAAALGPASEAKVRRLLSKQGPRSALGLTSLQRELFPVPLVSELTGVANSPQDDRGHISECLVRYPPRSFAAMAAAEVAVYLQAMLLPDADTFSMASSVELRVPFVDSHVFSAALESARNRNKAPGKATIAASLNDPYLKALARQPKRGFSIPMARWLAGPLAPLLAAADEPDARLWSLVDRHRAVRAGLVPLRPRHRWSETWALVALNAWLDTWAGGSRNACNYLVHLHIITQ